MDLNGDGHADVLSGCYMRSDLGMPGLFHVLYGDGDAGLRPAEVLNGAALKRDVGTRGAWFFSEESGCSQSVTSDRRLSVCRLRLTAEETLY